MTLESEVTQAGSWHFSRAQPWGPGKVLLDGYKIIRILGEGGMGTVYLVERKISHGSLFFAVKTLLSSALKDKNQNRALLRELRTWIDLPVHPNLTACRFFRTVEDRLVIFSEYVDGGSLQDWIAKGKVNTIELILDIAIQTAWGLQAAHEMNVVHQDIKSSNILMSEGGIAKVTDFGLARARYELLLGEDMKENHRSLLVSTSGMTPAYCSPEQAIAMKVSNKTDMWSWAVTVLEMFLGGTKWKIGCMAGEVLEMISSSSTGSQSPCIPDPVKTILRRCFSKKPEDRWGSMSEIAEMLVDIYRQSTDKPYTRVKPLVKIPSYMNDVITDRITPMGGYWDDPRDWLKNALTANQQKFTEIEKSLPGRFGSRKAQAITDLEVFEEAERIYLDLIEQGTQEELLRLAALLKQKAMVHFILDDFPGSFSCIDRSIEILERLKEENPDKQIEKCLSDAYSDKMILVVQTGDSEDALVWCDKALEIHDNLDSVQDSVKIKVASLYMNKGIIKDNQGVFSEGIGLLDKASELLQTLQASQKQKRQANQLLGKVLLNKAAAFRKMGDQNAALDLNERSIRLFEEEYRTHGGCLATHELAKLYLNKAIASVEMYRAEDTLGLFEKASNLMSNLIYQQGWKELEKELVIFFFNQAMALLLVHRPEDALSILYKAVEIAERLLFEQGRSDIRDLLAKIYGLTCDCLLNVGKIADAFCFMDRDIEIKEYIYQNKPDEINFISFLQVWLGKAKQFHQVREITLAHETAGKIREMIQEHFKLGRDPAYDEEYRKIEIDLEMITSS